MTVLQPYKRIIGTDGKAYMKARTRPAVPYIPDVPVLLNHSQLTGVSASCNGVPLPGGGGGTGADRDTTLLPWYGKLGDVGSPYAKTGPTKDQVGLSVPYSTLTHWNPVGTDNTNVTTTLTLENYIVHGRLKLSGAGKIIATNCVFDGPTNPDNTTLFTGETAVIDGNNAGVAQSYLKDCVIYNKVPHPRFNAHKGSRIKFERCHIFWCTDGFGPYTTPNSTFPTAFELVACRVERLVYWPGNLFADQSPKYWNGASYQPAGSAGLYTRPANGTALDNAGYFDLPDANGSGGHNDGNHTDCIEIHNAFGTHTFNPTSKTWSGDGIHIWGNALICDDAFGAGNPSNLPLTTPFLGYGDNPHRGLPGGGQKPGMARPVTSWTKPVSTGKYAGNGVSVYVGQVTNVQFEDQTSVVIHDNYINGGNMGMQEQKKSLSYIAFVFYDNNFGPDYFMWASTNDRDVYTVRINDYAAGFSNVMPNWTTGPVRIPNHPVTNAPPFGTGASNVWVGASKWGYSDGTPVGLGSSTVAGIRVI